MLFKKTRREGFSETDENKKDMKRLFIVSICCMIGLLYVSAQKSTLSSEELKFHNGIEQFLKEEGFDETYKVYADWAKWIQLIIKGHTTQYIDKTICIFVVVNVL